MCFATNLNAVLRTHQKRLKWESKVINITVMESFNSDKTIVKNICDTIGKKGRPKLRATEDDHYWLPPEFNQNTAEFRKTVLVPYFVRACVEAGFNVISKGRENDKVRLFCNRGRAHIPKSEAATSDADQSAEGPSDLETATTHPNVQDQPTDEVEEECANTDTTAEESDDGYDTEESETNLAYVAGSYITKFRGKERNFKKIRRSYRPVKGKEETCGFKFTVYWSPQHQRWYLPKEQAGSTKHLATSRETPRSAS